MCGWGRLTLCVGSTRYQYDPKPQVQQTMRAIWAAIVPETAKTVTRYLPQITDEVRPVYPADMKH